MRELYAPFTRTGAPILMMDTASAELCSYAANSILADAHLVHERDRQRLRAGRRRRRPGAQGDRLRPADRHVVPLSRRRLRRQLLSEGREGAAEVVATTRIRLQDPAARSKRVNEAQKKPRSSTRWKAHFRRPAAARTIALWGLAFKPRTDDMREAPAIVDHRPAAGARRDRCARTIRKRARRRGRIFDERIALCEKSYDALTGADALAIVTEWNEFREPDFDRMRQAAADAGRVRRPEHLLARAHAHARLHLLLHWTVTSANVLVTGRRGLHRQSRRQGAPPGRPPGGRLRQPGRRPSRRRQIRRVSRGRHRRRGGRARRAATARDLRRSCISPRFWTSANRFANPAATTATTLSAR